MKNTKLCQGLFIRNDKNGNPIHVGDTVKVTRPAFILEEDYNTGDQINISSDSWSGKLKVILSQGLVIHHRGGYRKVDSTDNTYLKWTWELIKKAS